MVRQPFRLLRLADRRRCIGIHRRPILESTIPLTSRWVFNLLFSNLSDVKARSHDHRPSHRHLDHSARHDAGQSCSCGSTSHGQDSHCFGFWQLSPHAGGLTRRCVRERLWGDRKGPATFFPFQRLRLSRSSQYFCPNRLLVSEAPPVSARSDPFRTSTTESGPHPKVCRTLLA